MPCRREQEPNQREIELSKVYQLLDEVKKGPGKLSKDYGSGYDKRAYNQGKSQKDLDEATAELCGKLKLIEKSRTKITKYSLELQTWWRDHKEADKRHKKEDAAKRREEKTKAEALKKLSPKERKALGL